MSPRAWRREVEGLRLKAEAVTALASIRQEPDWDLSVLDLEEINFLRRINRKLNAGLEPTQAEREAYIALGMRAGAPAEWFED